VGTPATAFRRGRGVHPPPKKKEYMIKKKTKPTQKIKLFLK
jgi:hypothetical protein